MEIPIIDVDTHLSEPPDLWTSRLSSKWGDRIPHVEFDEKRGEDRWVVAGRRLSGVASWASAGWTEFPPGHPLRIEDADPAAFEAEARVKRMDEEGILAEVIYSNLLGFSAHAFLALDDPELILACVRAYNDYLTDFASVAPERFILLTVLPFWDVKASVEELIRCHEKGHRGILFLSKPYKFALPAIADPHWHPIFAEAQDRGLSVNFHVGFQDLNEEDLRAVIGVKAARSDYAKMSSLSMLGLAEGVAEVVLSGVCHEFPNLSFVSVESGFGWMPYFMETMDWQWINSGAAEAYPEREKPSFYLKRQVYGTYWFETLAIQRMIDLFQDNIMFETDFPHATSLSPGPVSSSDRPREMAERSLVGIDKEIQKKVLYSTASRLYGVAVPT
jgi:uncharacterized protein